MKSQHGHARRCWPICFPLPTWFLRSFPLFSSSLVFATSAESLLVVLVGSLKGGTLTCSLVALVSEVTLLLPNYYHKGPLPVSPPCSHLKPNKTKQVSRSGVCKILFDDTPRWTAFWSLLVWRHTLGPDALGWPDPFDSSCSWKGKFLGLVVRSVLRDPVPKGGGSSVKVLWLNLPQLRTSAYLHRILVGLWCRLGLVELGSEIWCCLQRAFLECSRRATHKEPCFVCEARGLPVGRQLGDGEWVGPATSWRPRKPGLSDSRGQREPIRSFEQGCAILNMGAGDSSVSQAAAWLVDKAFIRCLAVGRAAYSKL